MTVSQRHSSKLRADFLRVRSLYRSVLLSLLDRAMTFISVLEASRFICDFDVYDWLTYLTEMHI